MWSLRILKVVTFITNAASILWEILMFYEYKIEAQLKSLLMVNSASD